MGQLAVSRVDQVRPAPKYEVKPARKWLAPVLAINRELWLIFTVFVIALVLNNVVSSQRLMLSFYTLPTIFSAYFFGRRHATLTAVFSALVVVLLVYSNTTLFTTPLAGHIDKWSDLGIWAGFLILIAYSMGTLYEFKENNIRELRQTYHGVLMILHHFVSKDKYTQNHSYRVSVYAARIAARMGFSAERIEDVRAAALLHDIGKLDISREILYKAARLNKEEYAEVQSHVEKGVGMLEPLGGSLRRIIPIILAHHDRFDGNGLHPLAGEDIPLEARILSVADVYDALTSDRPYRKAMSPFEVREIILKGAGKEFDPQVVRAFELAFNKGEMEVSEIVV